MELLKQMLEKLRTVDHKDYSIVWSQCTIGHNADLLGYTRKPDSNFLYDGDTVVDLHMVGEKLGISLDDACHLCGEDNLGTALMKLETYINGK